MDDGVSGCAGPKCPIFGHTARASVVLARLVVSCLVRTSCSPQSAAKAGQGRSHQRGPFLASAGVVSLALQHGVKRLFRGYSRPRGAIPPNDSLVPQISPQSVQPIKSDDEAAGVVSKPRHQAELVLHSKALRRGPDMAWLAGIPVHVPRSRDGWVILLAVLARRGASEEKANGQ